MIKYLNKFEDDINLPKIYCVYHITESGVNLLEITRDQNKLLKYNNSVYHMIYQYNYKGPLALVAPNKGVHFKSLIKQQLSHFNKGN